MTTIPPSQPLSVLLITGSVCGTTSTVVEYGSLLQPFSLVTVKVYVPASAGVITGISKLTVPLVAAPEWLNPLGPVQVYVLPAEVPSIIPVKVTSLPSQ